MMEDLNARNAKAIFKEMKALKCMAGLSPEALGLLCSVSVKRTFKPHELIWEMGDPGEFIAVIASGFLEITRYSSRDEEMCVGIFGSSDVVGLSAVLNKTTYPGSARVLTKGTVVLKIYLRSILQKKDREAAEIQSWVREVFLHHEQILRDKIDILGAGRIEDRVFELLNHFIRRFGVQESKLGQRIPLSLTRAQVGKLVDSRVETVIRLVNRWKSAGLVRWNKDEIVIENLALLEKSLHRNKRFK